MSVQLTPSLKPSLRPSAGLRMAIGLLNLSNHDLAARLSVLGAERGALRLVAPDQDRRLIFDPEGIAASDGSLIRHVLGQLAGAGLAPRDRALALLLIEGLEPTGWLGCSLHDVARASGLPLAEVERVLTRLQRFDPAGIFARDLAECLRLQAVDLGVFSPAMAAVLADLPGIAATGCAAIAARTGLPLADLTQALGQVRGMNPKPGLAFDPGPVLPAAGPDLSVAQQGQAWVVTLMGQSLPTLRGIADLRAADRLLMDALARRNETVLRVGQAVVDHQVEFLHKGPAALRVLSSATLADLLGLHLATVNRVLSGLSIATPQGRMRLRDLVPRAGALGSALPAPLLRARVHAALAAHVGPKPLTDARLAAELSQEGIAVSRRTVAKLRASLGDLRHTNRRVTRPA